MCGKTTTDVEPIVVDGATKVRNALAAVEDVLLGYDRASRDLWAILTALRGPDSDDNDLKTQFTVPVRRAAFPRLAGDIGTRYTTPRANRIIAAFGSEQTPSALSIDRPEPRSHFLFHIVDAISSLRNIEGA